LARLLVPAPSSRLLTMGLIGTVCGMAVLAAGCSVPELRAEFIARTRGLFWRSYAHQ
jgi:Ca2+/Na+ antiporter